jgi:cell wall-associated NlpC family hydrolase
MRGLIPVLMLVVLAPSVRAQERVAPPHLHEAIALVTSLKASQTNYQHGAQLVLWPNGNRPAEARCDCSGFVQALLTRSYGYSPSDYQKWFGVKRPLAAHYHDTIAKENGFALVTHVRAIQPGDILAIKYAALAADKSTGHVMLVLEPPKPMAAKKPFIDGTEQWTVSILDSTKSPHGRDDTRMSDNGTKGDGVGRGDLRLYADHRGDIDGYAWSTSTASTFRQRATHSLVVGRLVAGFKP